MSALPVRKVGAAGLGGAVATGVIWALSHFAGIELGEEVAAALVTIITFGVGYLVPGSGTSAVTLRSPTIAGLLAIAMLAITLSGCTWLTGQIDDATDTTLAERCQDYRLTIVLLSIVLAADGELSEDNQRLLDTSTAFVEAYCAGVGSPEPLPPPAAPADGVAP